MKHFYVINLFFIFIFILPTSKVQAQKRYRDDIYEQVDSLKNIQYGSAINIKNVNEQLFLDIFKPPLEDTNTKRPLLIFIHGGG